MKSLPLSVWVSLALLSGLGSLGSAVPPWWQEYSALSAEPPNDHAVATVGQAKHMLKKAGEAMEQKFALYGGKGSALQAFVSSGAFLNNSSDSSPLTIGQLKTLARYAYDRPMAMGVSTEAVRQLGGGAYYPWSSSAHPDDSAPATIGQVKFLFSFDFATDVDRDGIPDWIAGRNSDADAMPDWWEERLGTDPQQVDLSFPSPSVTITFPVNGTTLP